MPGYSVTPILAGGGADAINNNLAPNTMMVGVAYGVNVQGLIFKNGSVSLPAALASGYANAVNNAETVVGCFGSGIGSGRAFSYSVASGALFDLQAQLGGVANGEARGINNNQMVVGGTWNGSARGSFLYNLKKNKLTPISPPGAFQSTATAINDNNQVVGMMWPTADPYAGHQAYLYDAGTGAFTVLPGEVSPYGINNTGVVVGRGAPGVNPVVCSPPGYVAVVVGPNAPPSPQTSNGEGVAYGINNLGDVVGEVDLGARMHGFIYSLSTGAFQDLNALLVTSGWHIIIGMAINDQGLIVAGAFNLV